MDKDYDWFRVIRSDSCEELEEKIQDVWECGCEFISVTQSETEDCGPTVTVLIGCEDTWDSHWREVQAVATQLIAGRHGDYDLEVILEEAERVVDRVSEKKWECKDRAEAAWKKRQEERAVKEVA